MLPDTMQQVPPLHSKNTYDATGRPIFVSATCTFMREYPKLSQEIRPRDPGADLSTATKYSDFTQAQNATVFTTKHAYEENKSYTSVCYVVLVKWTTP